MMMSASPKFVRLTIHKACLTRFPRETSRKKLLSTWVPLQQFLWTRCTDVMFCGRYSGTTRSKSSAIVEPEFEYSHYQPKGDLFEWKLKQGASGATIVEGLVGKTASILRVFGPSDNAKGLLTCGGEELARQASFDPDYETAKGWIRSRAIGPAVLSPILISGLVGALVEAALPQSVPMSCSMNFIRPLIVGVEVCARIEVESVKETQRDGTAVVGNDDVGGGDRGYEIALSTKVIRVQDDAVIAQGSHTVWIPSYLTM